jgi:hypothetical protein
MQQRTASAMARAANALENGRRPVGAAAFFQHIHLFCHGLRIMTKATEGSKSGDKYSAPKRSLSYADTELHDSFFRSLCCRRGANEA